MTSPAPGSDRERPKLLLVDDRPDNLVALQAILQSLGLEMVTAGSGEQALKQLLTHDIAVILLDVQMPGMDGFETAAHIKRRERTRHIPIIFLTAIDREPAHTFRGYAAGAVDYLAKPFDPWVLRAKVSVLVDLYEKSRLVIEQAERLREHIDPQRIARQLEAMAEDASAGMSSEGIAQQLRNMAESLRDAPMLQEP